MGSSDIVFHVTEDVEGTGEKVPAMRFGRHKIGNQSFVKFEFEQCGRQAA